MVFGRKGVGDKELEGQRQRLAQTESLLANLEQGAGRLDGYRTQFSDVWFECPFVADALVKIRQARELLGHIRTRLATASRATAEIDEHLGQIHSILETKVVALDSFVALLTGRQHIWNAEGRVKGDSFDPSVRESQQALHANASQNADKVQEQIDELSALQERHRESWPRNLDLAHMQNYLDDGRQALDIYAERLASHDKALPPESSITLLVLAQRMEKGVEMIQGERASLAVDILSRGYLKKSEPS